jgi:threonine synthase
MEKNIRMPWCRRCGGMLECIYAIEALKTLQNEKKKKGLSRFIEVLPIGEKSLNSLGEGDTPLLESKRLSKDLGLKNLHFKNEALNPTGSFKDRGICISSGIACNVGAKGLLTVSSGNAAASLATYAAAYQLPCLVLVDNKASDNKIQQILFMGAKCVCVEGVFDRGFKPLLKLIEKISKTLDYWCAFSWAPLNPFSVEGTKTIAYECASIMPDTVICPVAGGDNLAGQWKGYKELYKAGVIEKTPKMIGVQPRGSSPMVMSFKRGQRKVTTIRDVNTKIAALRTTFSGDHALKAIYDSGGFAVEVDDHQTYKHQRLLAETEGIWVESASAVTLASLPVLLESAIIGPEEKIVCVLTGAGFKESSKMHEGVHRITADFDHNDIMEKYLKI